MHFAELLVAFTPSYKHNNLKKNYEKASKQGYRHESIIKEFAFSLLFLIGKAGYDFLHANFDNTLP